MATERASDAALRAEILRMAEQRGRMRTLCPSEAARSIGGEQWRELMPAARSIAFDLAATGLVDVTQHGAKVDVGARGPIRIRWNAVGDGDSGRDDGATGR
ncbi:DUF3253 domain-containing protein [Arthrobacter echini]|uniref:DUF3253 domain-containing protein n=1 Tax=Arthrobacter echini TaxID=1529066 RepID=A0A4S5E5M3_9MICC|nr:DUF3253 domain-containing protein [Arthrobacter echini]THJ66740.1 DUF3253 domain-containing protein [Arthrobacter echini]